MDQIDVTTPETLPAERRPAPSRTRRKATALTPVEPSEPRETLAAYFADIAHSPTLSREEQMLLAKEVEAATASFRDAVFHMPVAAREFVRIWRETQAGGRTTRKLSESFGTQEAEVGERLDACLTKVARDVRRREKLLADSPQDAAAIGDNF